jgi:signal transduction histidine kinase
MFDEQFRLRRHDGLYRWMRSVGQPRWAPDGGLLGYVGATYDITEIKEAQERLEQSSMELERAVNAKTTELQQSQERLRALASELHLTEQRERKRLATELHDHLQQMLVLGKLTIGQGKRSASGVPAYESVLKKVDDILSDALIYSRTLVAELSPPVLRDHGLAASLKWLAEYMKTKHEQTVTVLVPDDHGLHLTEEQRVLLFQSVRELLINSAKHAGTGQATLTMEQHADYVRITVHDDGKGFDPAVVDSGTLSGGLSSKFGLFSIQERMRALGGSFEIYSALDKGTTAILVLPLAESMADQGASIGDSPFLSHRLPADTGPGEPSTIRMLLVDDQV